MKLFYPPLWFSALLITMALSLMIPSSTQAVPEKSSSPHVPADSSPPAHSDAHQVYLDFFEKVFQTMNENYYQPVSRETFKKFIEQFNDKIYVQLKGTGKTDNYVKWRGASLLVEKLKSPEDTFSEIYPPKPAVEYKESSLGTKIDLGIEGRLVPKGYEITRIEPHSDSYAEGLRERDILLAIDKKKLNRLKEEEIKDLLNPLAGSKVSVKFFDVNDSKEKVIDVISKEYFKQTLFLTPTKVAGIYCLRLEHFNQKTGEDMYRFLRYLKEHGSIKGLILDLRNNPGGPPLAAREISSFFLPGGEPFAYFQKREQPKAWLDVPKIPEQYHYDGPIVILVNKESGSASELFAGILQKRGRAVLMGANSAGKVLLKSMFDFEDKSMLLLVTGRGHHPDGSVFSFQGLTPDHYFMEDKGGDIMDYATKYLVYINRKSQPI